jgi:hypothetical protein
MTPVPRATVDILRYALPIRTGLACSLPSLVEYDHGEATESADDIADATGAAGSSG